MVTGVSRETPAPPAEAGAVFGAVLPLAVRYAELLAGPGVERGLIGPREVPRLWERHLLNCAALTPVVDQVLAAAGAADPAASDRDGRSTVVDLGSGAGLPGLVLAMLRPHWRVVLVEPMLRRTTFLQEAIDELGLLEVAVLRGRAEDDAVRTELAERGPVDVVTARAVAPLDRLAEWALPLLTPGGSLLALKGEAAGQELTAASPTLQRLGRAAGSTVSSTAGSTGGSIAGGIRSRVWELPDSPSRVIQVSVGGRTA